MGALDGVNVLEFGAGAAGPLATRYLADHGATVVRIESKLRPDFLRLYAITETQRSLDASPMFAAFNCNKRAITLNMKHPAARDVVLRLVRWADVVAENFAPGAMDRLGFSYERLRAHKPDLIMISTCLHGQTGPERDYPGFGGQGAAISGYNHLTGWPDGEPLGPYGTITDSLSPRFAALAMSAALFRRARTGEGAYIDLSQVEAAIYCLGDTIARFSATGEVATRTGNADARALLHGVYRCTGDDRWIAVAAWTPEDMEALGAVIGADPSDGTVEAWTSERTREDAETTLRAAGIDAAAVLDMGDLDADPQLAHRAHFHELEHPVIGRQRYEAMGFRLASSPPAFTTPGPTLGRDNDEVTTNILGLRADELEALRADGALD